MFLGILTPFLFTWELSWPPPPFRKISQVNSMNFFLTPLPLHMLRIYPKLYHVRVLKAFLRYALAIWPTCNQTYLQFDQFDIFAIFTSCNLTEKKEKNLTYLKCHVFEILQYDLLAIFLLKSVAIVIRNKFVQIYVESRLLTWIILQSF